MAKKTWEQRKAERAEARRHKQPHKPLDAAKLAKLPKPKGNNE